MEAEADKALREQGEKLRQQFETVEKTIRREAAERQSEWEKAHESIKTGVPPYAQYRHTPLSTSLSWSQALSGCGDYNRGTNTISGLRSSNLCPNLYLYDLGEKHVVAKSDGTAATVQRDENTLAAWNQMINNPVLSSYAEEEAVMDKLLGENLEVFEGQYMFQTDSLKIKGGKK